MMVFTTVGTQAPFDRLIAAVDALAAEFPGYEFVAQSLGGKYVPKNLTPLGFLDPKEFEEYFNRAGLIISHAGIGTIVSALTKNKPLLMMPRWAKMGEHRNNHQITTVKKFQELGYVHVAQDEEDLSKQLTIMLKTTTFRVLHQAGPWASSEFIEGLKKDFQSFL